MTVLRDSGNELFIKEEEKIGVFPNKKFEK